MSAHIVWKIKLIGGFEVWRPDGTKVWFKSRKASALLAMLLLNEGQPMARTDIARELWPQADHDAALTSLRQAIASLKNSLAEPGLFVTSRATCFVDLSSADCPDVQTLGQGQEERPDFPIPLLPEMPEPWFERKRAVLAAFGVPAWKTRPFTTDTASATDSAAVVIALDWAVHNSPSSALTLCRAIGDLIQQASPQRVSHSLGQALALAQPSDQDYGWAVLHKAIADLYLNPVPKTVSVFALLTVKAEGKGQIELAAHALVYQAAAMALTGQSAEAVALVRSFIHRHGDASQPWLNRSLHALGLALFHNGEFEQGAKTLDSALAAISPTKQRFEYAHVASNLAWLSAGARLERAADDLRRAKAHGPAGTWRFETTQLLAEASLSIESGNLDAADKLLAHAATMTDGATSTGFGEYINDGLSRLAVAKHQGNRAAHLGHVSRSRRVADGIVPSKWDKARVQHLA